MEVATQTSLTGLAVLWDVNIDPAAGFFSIDIIKEELLNCDPAEDDFIGVMEDNNVRRKIDEQIIKEMQKNKNVPAMTSIDLRILNEYSSNVPPISTAEKDICEANMNQKVISTSKFSFVVKSSKRNKIKNTTVAENKNETISICDKTTDKTLKEKDRINLTQTNIELNDKEVLSSEIKQLCKSSTKLSKTPRLKGRHLLVSSESPEKNSNTKELIKSVKEPSIVKNVPGLENQFSKTSSQNECSKNIFKTPTKNSDESKISSNIETKSPKKMGSSPNYKNAFKSFCTTRIKSSPVKNASNVNKQRNTPKNKNSNIRKTTKGIQKKNSPLVKKTIKKSKSENKTAIKALKNIAFSSSPSSCNLKVNDHPSNSDDDDDDDGAHFMGFDDGMIVSDDDVVEIASSSSVNNINKDRIDKFNISKDETFEKMLNVENMISSVENVGSDNKHRNDPKHENLNIRKGTKEILKENSPLLKKTIRKSTNETKTVVKSLKNIASSSISGSCNLKVIDHSNKSDVITELLGSEEVIVSDDILKIDTLNKVKDINSNKNDELNILNKETFIKKVNSENVSSSDTNIATDNKQNLKCSFCDYETSSKGRLINHIRKHTGIKPYACEKCDYKCTRKDTLNRHISLQHSGVNEYACPECDLQFITQKKVDHHIATYHSENPMTLEHLKCSFCGYTAMSKVKLTMHIRKHTGEKPFSCEKCDYKCARNDTLKVHMRLHSWERLSCSECDYTTNDKVDFQKHKITHKAENTFQCTECQITCKSQNALDKHISHHLATKQFICSECGHGYATKFSLKQHMYSEHEHGEVLSCSFCNFKCIYKQKLLKHILRHSGVKKYTCTECDLQFISQEQIDRHILTHPYEKPYKCSNCDYRCVDVSGLKEHIKSHHTGQLPYHCKDCGRLFSDKKKLRVHRNKKHKFEVKFYCSKCSYQCVKEEHLKDHMQTHLYTNARTFACSMCDFLCSGIHSFKEHMKEHVGQK